jgi:hypothetical protein
MNIRIATDFSETPGSRSREEGEFSGEEFLERCLLPKFKEALDEQASLFIDLDETEGYSTSFLEAAFGGLARIYDPQLVLNRLKFKSLDEPGLPQEIQRYIIEARTTKEAKKRK